MAKSFLRDPVKERFWRRMLTKWQRSRLSIRAFCAACQLTESNFYAWRSTLAQRDQQNNAQAQAPGRCRKTRPGKQNKTAAAPHRPPAFLPVRVLPEPAAATTAAGTSIELVLAGGRCLRITPGFDTVTLQQLLTVLEGQSC